MTVGRLREWLAEFDETLPVWVAMPPYSKEDGIGIGDDDGWLPTPEPPVVMRWPVKRSGRP